MLKKLQADKQGRRRKLATQRRPENNPIVVKNKFSKTKIKYYFFH